ncbi:hypothetical protein L3Q82_014522, partial [Scortum barcoo]
MVAKQTVWQGVDEDIQTAKRLNSASGQLRWATNRRCFLAKNESWQFRPSNIISNGVRQSGEGPRLLWRPPLRGIGDRRTSTGLQPPSTLK